MKNYVPNTRKFICLFTIGMFFTGCALTGGISGYESLNIGEDVCLSCWLGQKNYELDCNDRGVVTDKGYSLDEYGHSVEYVMVKFSNGITRKFIHCKFQWALTGKNGGCLDIWTLKRCN